MGQQELEAVLDKAEELGKRERRRSEMALLMELRQRARAERDLSIFMRASFRVSNGAGALFDHELRRSVALESIALLESRDRAREFQPDIDEGRLGWLVQHFSTCAYDHLARGVGESTGFNSPQLDRVLDEGIAVAHRVGRSSCVGCFRAYAHERARAADDVDMALHYCRAVRQRGGGADDYRRFHSFRDEANVWIDLGELDRARTVIAEAREYMLDTNHYPMAPRTVAFVEARIARLRGEPVGVPEYPSVVAPFEPEENPSRHLGDQLFEALGASLDGRFEEAGALLEYWDRRILKTGDLSEWFTVRLRLLANDARAGRTDRHAKLAAQLRTKARDAHDHSTLRRLDIVEALGKEVWPHVPLVPPRRAVAVAVPAAEERAPADAVASEATSAAASPAAPPEKSELRRRLEELGELTAAVRRGGGEPVAASAAVCAFADEIVHGTRSDRLYFLGCVDEVAAHAPDVDALWDATRRATVGLEEDALVLTMWSAVAHVLGRREGSTLSERVPKETILKWYEHALELAPDNALVLARKAWFHLQYEDDRSAERLLARSARLDRSNTWVALRLAEVYVRADRPGDALAVLDLAIRNGAENPSTLWEAALLANRLGERRALVGYVDRYRLADPDYSWGRYYLIVGLCGVEDWVRARSELDAARASAPELEYVWSSFEVVVRAVEGGDVASAVLRFLALPTRDVESLTVNGFHQALTRAYMAIAARPEHAASARELRARLLRLGLFGYEAANVERRLGDEVEQTGYFDVELHQDLPADWSDEPHRIPSTATWRAFRVTYGILAGTRDEAVELALRVHPSFGGTAAVLVEVRADEKLYKDRRGLYRQFAFTEHGA
jgi:tetratricopeptide (TPR) repeat protein